MKNIRFLFILALILTAPVKANDWPGWRGPLGNGIVEHPDGELALSWDEDENVVWKASIPGRGHSSPIIVGDQVILTTADEDKNTQSVIAFDRDDGKLLWNTVVHKVLELPMIHKKNTHASSTAASDGQRIFVTFFNDGMIHLSALGLDGEKQWQKQAGRFKPRYKFGYAASPLVYDELVIVASEFAEDGFLSAFQAETGTGVWKAPRNEATSYSSPVVGEVAGREQLLMSGAERISSYDPKSGELLWQTPGGTSATAGTMVWTATQVYASGGFPTKETIAIVADGSKRVAWKNKEKCYEQSLLAYDGHVYGLNDGGIAMCWRATDGREMWKERLGGPVSASPVLAGNHIFATNERGQTFVFEATPGAFQLVSTNQLGEEAFASPVVSQGRMYLRVATYEGELRKEWLYCVGKK